jgi:hypothetical protein
MHQDMLRSSLTFIHRILPRPNKQEPDKHKAKLQGMRCFQQVISLAEMGNGEP